jgi:hypothetical protein
MLHKKLLCFSTWQIDSFEDGSGYEKASTTDSNFVQTRVISSLTSTIFFTNAVQPSDVMMQLLPDFRESDHWLVNNCLNCLAPGFAIVNGPSLCSNFVTGFTKDIQVMTEVKFTACTPPLC